MVCTMERNKVGKKDWKILGGGKAVLNRMVLEVSWKDLNKDLKKLRKLVWNKQVPGRTGLIAAVLRCECAYWIAGKTG